MEHNVTHRILLQCVGKREEKLAIYLDSEDASGQTDILVPYCLFFSSSVSFQQGLQKYYEFLSVRQASRTRKERDLCRDTSEVQVLADFPQCSGGSYCSCSGGRKEKVAVLQFARSVSETGSAGGSPLRNNILEGSKHAWVPVASAPPSMKCLQETKEWGRQLWGEITSSSTASACLRALKAEPKSGLLIPQEFMPPVSGNEPPLHNCSLGKGIFGMTDHVALPWSAISLKDSGAGQPSICISYNTYLAAFCQVSSAQLEEQTSSWAPATGGDDCW